jgi:hypothetical protein
MRAPFGFWVKEIGKAVAYFITGYWVAFGVGYLLGPVVFWEATWDEYTTFGRYFVAQPLLGWCVVVILGLSILAIYCSVQSRWEKKIAAQETNTDD